jgi:hypothetical protein
MEFLTTVGMIASGVLLLVLVVGGPGLLIWLPTMIPRRAWRQRDRSAPPREHAARQHGSGH